MLSTYLLLIYRLNLVLSHFWLAFIDPPFAKIRLVVRHDLIIQGITLIFTSSIFLGTMEAIMTVDILLNLKMVSYLL